VPLLVEDYAIIGDRASAALVGVDGSVDWLCLPRFDSGACFAALLGTPDNGRWLVAPEHNPRPAGRRYREDSLVLETRLAGDDGEVLVIDTSPTSSTCPTPWRASLSGGGSGSPCA